MKILTLLFMFSFNCFYSQVVIYKGLVFSKGTNLPIENATVKIIKNDNTIFYTITNSFGKFSFKNSNSNEIYSIEISHLGYKKEIYKTIDSKFYLTEKKNELPEVVVSVKKKKLLFELPISDRILTHTRNSSWNHKMAVYIPQESKNKSKTIKKLRYAISDFEGVTGLKYQPFLANIYSVDTITKLPDKELIGKGIVVRKKDEKKWVEVDVSKYNFIIPTEGIFIVMELLDEATYYSRIVQSNIGMISGVPAIKAYYYNDKYIRKSYENYISDEVSIEISGGILDELKGWKEQNCHYLMDIEIE